MPRNKKKSDRQRREEVKNRMKETRASTNIITSCVVGTMNQGSEIFSSETRGSQCMCMALTAIAYNYCKTLSQWTTTDIDSILLQGDFIYHQNVGSNKQLSIQELPKQITVEGKAIYVSVYESFGGSMSAQESDGILYCLRDAINLAGRTSKSLIITVGKEYNGYSSSIMFCGPKLGYAVFDSHSRSEDGKIQSAGTAVLLKITTFDRLIEYFTRFAQCFDGEMQFELTSVSVANGVTTREFYTPFETYLESQRIQESKHKRNLKIAK